MPVGEASPRLALSQIDGATMGEDTDPAAHGRLRRVEFRRSLPEVEEGFLNGVLSQVAVAEDSEGEGTGDGGVAAV